MTRPNERRLTKAQLEAEIARLRDAVDGMVERCLDSGFPDEWIADDSSMAMQVTMGGRELAAARAALAPEAER